MNIQLSTFAKPLSVHATHPNWGNNEEGRAIALRVIVEDDDANKAYTQALVIFKSDLKSFWLNLDGIKFYV